MQSYVEKIPYQKSVKQLLLLIFTFSMLNMFHKKKVNTYPLNKNIRILLK